MIPTLHRCLLLALLFTIGCATPPTVGVRTEFRGRSVVRLALAPPLAQARFGLAEDEWRTLEHELLREATVRLDALGFVVTSPEALRDQLERARAWPRFGELIEPGAGLAARFEPNLYAPTSPEILTLRELSAEGLVDAQALLFIEIRYHSVGTCRVDPRDDNRFAEVVDAHGQAIETATPGPCVVTHLEAKLVDARSATTMWHNRTLRELRTADVHAGAQDNVRVAVTQLLAGAHGLGPFAPHAAP